MRPQQIMAFAGVFIVGTMLACISSGRWLLNGEIDIINALAGFNAVEYQAGGIWSVPKGVGRYWDAAVTALGWKYPFLEYEWAIGLRAILWIISIGVVWGFLQFAVTVIQGLVGFARSLIP